MKGSNGLLKEGLLIRNGPSLAFIRKVEYGEAEIAKHSEYSPKTCEKIILSEARNYFCPFLSSQVVKHENLLKPKISRYARNFTAVEIS